MTDWRITLCLICSLLQLHSIFGRSLEPQETSTTQQKLTTSTQEETTSKPQGQLTINAKLEANTVQLQGNSTDARKEKTTAQPQVTTPREQPTVQNLRKTTLQPAGEQTTKTESGELIKPQSEQSPIQQEVQQQVQQEVKLELGTTTKPNKVTTTSETILSGPSQVVQQQVVQHQVVQHQVQQEANLELATTTKPNKVTTTPETIPSVPPQDQLSGTNESINDKLKLPVSQSKELDLAFVMDTTGSMMSYIENARQNIRKIVDEIVNTSKSDVRLALIEYRDHSPEEETFVTRMHDFTNSVKTMKSWLNKADAVGGGDTPEAVADALFQTTKLSWRPEATKISVLVSDAPPHGLVPSEDSSFPNGSPNGHDSMKIARDLAQKGVTLYVIGCEPSIVPYMDFFMALAYLTGGQYVPLSIPRLLVNAITGGAEEELSLQRFQNDVEIEIQKAAESGEPINETEIIASVYQKLNDSGVETTQLLRNNEVLEGPTDDAKLLSQATSMAEVRKQFKKGSRSQSGAEDLSFDIPYGPDSIEPLSMDAIGAKPSHDRKETFSAVKKGITVEQVARLVKKGTSKYGTA